MIEALRVAYGADVVIPLGSGTQALQAALERAAAETGSNEVALPAFGCYDLASAAVGVGSRVHLYDVDPEQLAPDYDSLRRAVRSGACTVVLAPLFGLPIDWEEAAAFAATEGCLLIEDAAQGHGARWRDRPLGSWGPLGVISFGRGKGWTCGGGGALLVRGLAFEDTPAAASDARLKRYAVLLAQWALGRPGMYGIPAAIPGLGLGTTVYREPVPVHALPERALALLEAHRTAAEEEITVRRRNADLLRERLRAAGLPVFEPPRHSTPGWIRLPVRLPAPLRHRARDAAARRLGIAPTYPMSLARLPQLQSLLAAPDRDFPGANILVAELVTFPTHSRLTRRDLIALERFLTTPEGASP